MQALLRAAVEQIDGGDQLAGDNRRTATAAAVLRTILDHGPVARSTVARLTGLSAAAVSRQSTELAELGLVRERPVRRPRPAIGRPHVPVDIDTRSHLVGGIHIAVRHTTLVLMDLRGRVLAEQRTPHRDPAAAAVLADVGNRMAAFLDEHTCGRRPLGVGVATGGWIDPGRGVIVRHTQLDWRDVPAQGVLEDRLGLPVRVESHSRALARAEQLIGSHHTRARTSMVHLFVGNVVDAAIVTGGTVHHGPRSAAGDVSHLPVGSGRTLPGGLCRCGRTGCFQATVTEQALADHAASAGLLAEARFPDVVAALEADEPWAVALFRERARLVGRAVALLLDVINPEILVVAEAGIARRPQLLDELHAEVADRAHVAADPRRRIVSSSFGTRTLGVAAGSIVLHEAYARPLELRPSPAGT
jgi:predicted NBD/HSP70 family sugar kinase